MNAIQSKPIILITSVAGKLGRTLTSSLQDSFTIVGLDRKASAAPGLEAFAADFSSAESIELALHRMRQKFGNALASVFHLVAYFDFTNADNPLYRSVNVESARHLLRGLQQFDVEQFVYASSMLVHAPCSPGERIDETQPIAPG